MNISLDKLTLKIPWKNLYNDPVLIEVDGVYIVAGPETGIILHCIMYY